MKNSQMIFVSILCSLCFVIACTTKTDERPTDKIIQKEDDGKDAVRPNRQIRTELTVQDEEMPPLNQLAEKRLATLKKLYNGLRRIDKHDALTREAYELMSESQLQDMRNKISDMAMIDLFEPEWTVQKAFIEEAQTRYDNGSVSNWIAAAGYFEDAIDRYESVVMRDSGLSNDEIKYRISLLHHYRCNALENAGEHEKALPSYKEAQKHRAVYLRSSCMRSDFKAGRR